MIVRDNLVLLGLRGSRWTKRQRRHLGFGGEASIMVGLFTGVLPVDSIVVIFGSGTAVYWPGGRGKMTWFVPSSL